MNPDLLAAKEPDRTVYLNVGGKRFEVLWSTLGQFNSSRRTNYEKKNITMILYIIDI